RWRAGGVGFVADAELETHLPGHVAGDRTEQQQQGGQSGCHGWGVFARRRTARRSAVGRLPLSPICRPTGRIAPRRGDSILLPPFSEVSSGHRRSLRSTASKAGKTASESSSRVNSIAWKRSPISPG